MDRTSNSSFGRRARDRILLREGTDTDRLSCDSNTEAQILLADEELRDTAQALGRIEDFLVRALRAIEQTDRERLLELGQDSDICEQAELLGTAVEELQRRLLRLATGFTVGRSVR